MPGFRSAVLRIFQETAGKGFRFTGFLIGKNPRNHTGNRIHHHHGRKLASGKHIISDRNIIRDDLLKNPLVNSLVMTAEKNKILFFCKILCHFLVKNLSLRGQINNPWLIPDLFFNGFIGKIHRLCLHQHSGAASIGIIVNLLMLIKCIVPDINCFDIQKAACHGPADNTGIHPVPDHVRKKRQHIKIHYISPFIKCMVIIFFSRSTSRIHSLIAGRRTSPCSAESII